MGSTTTKIISLHHDKQFMEYYRYFEQCNLTSMRTAFAQMKSGALFMRIKYNINIKIEMCEILNIFNFAICIATLSQTIDPTVAIKRGPHHPRSEQSKNRKVDQHLTIEEHHIENDLKEMGINSNLDEMSEEEKNFYYFKMHDNDNNNALDGLEMLQAAIHQDENFKKIDRDNYIAAANDELEHIVSVIDEFLELADANKDGLLHYPEYVKAVTDAPVEEMHLNDV